MSAHCIQAPKDSATRQPRAAPTGSQGRPTMITPARPLTHAGLCRHGLPRRRQRCSPPTVFSGTIFRLRPRLEVMEDRTLLSTFVVNNTSDSGPGSLRQAILDSNAYRRSNEHDRLRHPGDRRADDRPSLAPARDHQPGPDRRHIATGLRRHAADRAERQPGRRRRRPDDHRRRTSPSAASTSTTSARAPAFTSRAQARPATGSMATSWAPIRPARRPSRTNLASKSTGAPATT